MDGPVEELEPLFDYSRVQPTDFISFDEDDSLEAFPICGGSGCKRKKNGPAEDEKKGKKQHSIVNLEDEDDDWLAPPPKIATVMTGFVEDKILQELRLKKQELVSISQSAETVLKAVMENARNEHSCATNSGAESTEEEGSRPAKSQSEKQKIVISIQDKDGSKQFRIYKDDKLEKLFKLYADKAKLEISNLAFTFDGDKVQAGATPISLGLEDDDMIEVHHKA